MKWRREAGIVWEDDGDAIWAVHPAVGELVSLTGVGAVVWDWLDAPWKELVAELARASDEPVATIERDLDKYLEELEKLRLVTRV